MANDVLIDDCILHGERANKNQSISNYVVGRCPTSNSNFNMARIRLHARMPGLVMKPNQSVTAIFNTSALTNV